MGILLNDSRLMEMTNVIGETLEDPWKLEGLSRKMLKSAATPMLYGSSRTCIDFWRRGKFAFTQSDVDLYNKEMSSGPLGLVNMLKDFLIHNCNPRARMDIVIGEEEFEVRCNRFRNVGEKTKAYRIWDSIDKRYNTILHTDTKRVPDLEQFRLYMPTLLIHNLDSQSMNYVTKKLKRKYGWAIPIHDAVVISPAAAADARMWYAEFLEGIHKNRKMILQNFFKSIGVTASSYGAWEAVKSRVVPLEGELKVSQMALK